LIVDEPTAGLDPEERVRLRTLLQEMASDRIIIFSTHICSDVESVAKRIAIMNGGRLLAHDVPSSLLRGCRSLEDAYLRVIAGARAAA
jgi:ABC-2 type transport system ATP-binding protein